MTSRPTSRGVVELPLGPPGRPFVGHLPDLRRDLLGFFTRCAREHGDVVPLRFGPRRAILFNHPAHIEEILITRHRDFVKSDAFRILSRVVGQGLVTSEGEVWLRQRRRCSAARPCATPRSAATASRDTIVISPWTVHRDGRWFERPEEFRPERWTPRLAAALPKFAYFPFGGGPRGCVGAGFAKMEATILLSLIAKRFRLELMPDQEVVPEPSITLRPKYGLRMRLRERAG